MLDSSPDDPGGRTVREEGNHRAGPNPTSVHESEAGHLQKREMKVLIALIKEKRKHSIMKAQTSPWP